MKKDIISFAASELSPLFSYLIKWLLLAILIGALAGSASAVFLIALDWATRYRETHVWIISLLPLAGLLVGLIYHYYGSSVVKGNNLLIEEFHTTKKIIPIKMAPLVLGGTLLTHLFGGSAGREGTALQMAGAIADQFNFIFRFRPRDRKILLLAGISAGFASVFGTPLAGAVFALEVMVVGAISYEAILPVVLAAVCADYACRLWPVVHTQYSISACPAMNPENLFWAILAGIAFGLVSRIFSKATHFWTAAFQRGIRYAPLRPFAGGVMIAIVVALIGTRYIGLGIPVIVSSFGENSPSWDFVAKILLTSFTLGAGFKGGEVTPLFFIGATLGSALAAVVPLPTALLAGMGFVAVFGGAANTPIACIVMGIELFGVQGGLFIGVACVVAYLFSGHSGIYGAQVLGSPKHLLFGREKGQNLFTIYKRKNNLL